MPLPDAVPYGLAIPRERLVRANEVSIRGDGHYVLYWMIATRRPHYNFALEYAIARARELGKPLLVFEPLRTRYRWASDRLHRFVIEGMQQNEAHFARTSATYYPYVEPQPGVATPLLRRLAEKACLVVSDDYPGFFLPRMIDAVKKKLPARLELVDSNGVIPMRQPDRTFTVAHSYRRWMQKNILDALASMPKENPLDGIELPHLHGLPNDVQQRWPAAQLKHLLRDDGLSEIPIDHSVRPVAGCPGGVASATNRLRAFLANSLSHYAVDRNHPDRQATSGLSSYLHFGHLSAHQIVAELQDAEDWTPDQAAPPNGKNHGFWMMSESGEAFLDQLLTWREMGFNLAHREPQTYDRYESLPNWAQKTLDEHADDPRPYQYDQQQFEQAETHDELWNAAQRQLVRTGVMHNYLRMLWGKKILHWTASPQEALQIMIHLNNKYGLDGRDPNSYSGVFWVLGRYDRAWGPKRPVFGSVRYMTSDSARKKLKLDRYLQQFAEAEA